MGVRIETISGNQRGDWDTLVDRSPQTTVFHQYDALESLARYFDATVNRLVGYVGDEPIGLLPVFDLARGPFTLATSPPPAVEINVGPALLNFRKLKQRKAEHRHGAFIDGCLDWIEREIAPDYLKIGTNDRYGDVRPFLRRGLDVRPAYTYVLDISDDDDELLMHFSRDARSNIRNTDDQAYEIREGGVEAIEEIVPLVQRRYAAQDENHYLDADLVVDLYSALGPEQVRPYTCRVDGCVVSGIIALEYDNTVYRWQGGPKPDVDLPVNDLLDWHVIQTAKGRDRGRYDFVGAMQPRLCEYKSKFGPEPVVLYVTERRCTVAKVASQMYRRLPSSVRDMVGL